ncbi:DNA topoisomerase 2-binding protein 1-A [Cloeon dipterum]|uniref:DNA topoisomerase 2-binding protein 1-A n=1 Tax=Cloeon dipterum TaxID=197152 RepID=UPI0032205D0D
MEKSFNERGLRMYFVRQSKSPAQCFTKAFQSCQEKLIMPKMVDESECDKLQVDRKSVFVFETFQGKFFERLLKENAPCAVLGAPCILECLSKGEPTPESSYPVFSLAMRGLRVCVSGFKLSQKDELGRKVRFMGGIFEKNLSTVVTHLVTQSTNTDKYQCAIEIKIPVMLENWVHETWEANQKKHQSALDEPYISLRCPPFQGLTITSSQFTKAKKDKIKSIIEQNGGQYCPSMTSTDTDVLIVSTATGDKYRAAVQWNIPCVTENWISDSAKAGYSLNYAAYEVKVKPGTSTPERNDATQLGDLSCVSAIAHQPPQQNKINETMMSTVSCATNMSFAEPRPPERREPPRTPEKEPDAAMKIMKLPITEIRKAGLFLDGCRIYVSEGMPCIQDKLRKMLNSSGATRFDDISEGLTHVLQAGKSLRPLEAHALARLSRKPPVVPLSWLFRSFELQHAAEASGEQPATEPPSPLSKRGMQMFKSPQKLTISPKTAKNDLAVMQEYLKDNLPPSASQAEPSAENHDNEGEEEEELALPLLVFSKLKFQLKGLNKSESSELRTTLESMGGSVVSKDADYIIGPFKVQAAAPNQVTEYWIQECSEQGEVLPINYYHRPILFRPRKPLDGTVITISTYTGRERSYLSTLATEMGAKYQEIFAKKATPARGALASTHLICPSSEGTKFVAASKWQLPAVTKDWLLQCAASNSRLSEEPFLLSGPAAPSPSASVLSTSATSIQREDQGMVTPVRPPPKDGFPTPFTPVTPYMPSEESSTDEVKRIARLSLTSFRKAVDRLDPDYLSTPETPYGQVMKEGDSPVSPETRKAWKRYLNSIPDSTPKTTSGDAPMEKVNKRMRIEEIEEELDELNRKRRRDVSNDSDIDDELLKKYSSQKETENGVDHEKENMPSTSTAAVAKADPEPVEEHEETLQLVERPPPLFMVTGLVERDLEHISLVVTKLGGSMSKLKNFDPAATHLITSNPSRSEKLLAAMAAGLWVVHPQFLIQSARSGSFLSEDDFEWGNPAAASFLEPLVEDNPLASELAAACYRWRRKAAAGKAGAFACFRAVLLGAPHKTAAFERMITAGGGSVVPYPSDDLKSVTHCFVDMNKVNTDLSPLRAAKVPCYNPIYLSDYLIKEPLPNPQTHRV